MFKGHHPFSSWRFEAGLFIFLVLLSGFSNGTLTLWFLLRCVFLYFHTGQFGINHDTTTILTYNDLLVHLDIQLSLRRNLVEATTTSITLHIDNAQSVS